MGSCWSDTSQEDSNIHGMAYNTGGHGKVGRTHREQQLARQHEQQRAREHGQQIAWQHEQLRAREHGQQAARQQHVSTPQYKPGSYANQSKGSGSPSAKRARGDSRSRQRGHQTGQPQSSPPPSRLLPSRPPVSPYLVNRQNENEPNERVWDQKQDQIRDLEQKLQKSKEDFGALWDRNEAERTQLEEKVEFYQRRVQDIQIERTRHAQEVEFYKQKLREMEAQMQSANKAQTDKRRLQDLEMQIADLKRDLQQSQQDNKNLRNSYEVLQGEHKSVKSKNQDLLQRISSMASERMRSNNPCVEDLSDPHRHSAVLSAWQALMNGEYWTLYEAALKQMPDEQNTAGFLLRIMELGFKEAQYLQNGSKPFMDLMQSQRQAQSKHDPGMAALLDSLLKNENFREIVDSESKKVLKGGRATLPANACQDFHAKIRKEWRNLRGDLLNRSDKFADEVLRLCFLMALQSPPMALVFDRPEDREMDALLYEPDGDRNRPRPWTVKFVLTPPLLRHEGGPVLCKGTVELR